MDTLASQGLYGGAIRAVIPQGWLDASNLRQVPDHQELFLSPTTLSTLIFEINERVSNETALAALSTSSSTTTPTTETDTDKAAVLYHLNDLLDNGSDTLRRTSAPQQVSLPNLPKARAYKGAAVITSTTPDRSRPGPASIGGAAAGSSAEGALVSSVSLHYLLVRLEEQETDMLVFFNVPHKEFEEKGDLTGLNREETLAEATMTGIVSALEVVEWGLFGG
ncbi:hypothetical protein BJX61DRAFT_468100 [Aspergillus egyptiacus]|nr:hypothetical protein BJX61DRAFT_468100 [Aspergillus egyptiacus]